MCNVMLLVVVILCMAFTGNAVAETITTTYSYDNLSRVTQAVDSGGSSVLYQYDPNGNLLTLTRDNTTGLTFNQPLGVNLAVPGQSATLTFTATAGETVVLNVGSISTSTQGAVTVSVYSSAGALIGTTAGTMSATLTLPNLSAGTYSVVITPPTSATGIAQLTLASIPVASSDHEGGDAPLPLWALFTLGSGLVGILYRANRRVTA